MQQERNQAIGMLDAAAQISLNKELYEDITGSDEGVKELQKGLLNQAGTKLNLPSFETRTIPDTPGWTDLLSGTTAPGAAYNIYKYLRGQKATLQDSIKRWKAGSMTDETLWNVWSDKLVEQGYTFDEGTGKLRKKQPGEGFSESKSPSAIPGPNMAPNEITLDELTRILQPTGPR